MQALVPSLWKGSPPYETRGEPADASRERLGSNGSGSGGGPAASVEEKRILATRMQKAANNGFDVLSLLEKGADPTSADIDGRTALHYAAMNGHTFAAVCLCAYGSDLKARTNNGRTALHGACWNGHTQTALQLIELGADAHAKSFDGSTPLMDAARNSHTDTVSTLVSVAGADVHARESGGRTALHFAALNGHAETVAVLISLGAAVDASDADGSRPIHFASWNGHTGTVRALLVHGAGVSPRDAFLSTPLHDAALGGRTETAGLLLDYSAEVNARNYRGITPLHSSSSSGHAETTLHLLERGASVDAPNDDGRTALHFATWNTQPLVAFELLSRGADMFLCSDDGLMAADILCSPDFEWPEELIVPLHCLRLPCTPLHDAADKGDIKTIENLVLGRGVDVNCENSLGDTPLHWAIRSQHVSAAARLISLGASLQSRNNVGVSCVSDVATFMSNKQQIRMQRKVAAYPPFLGGAADGGAEGTQQWLATSLPSEDDEGMGGNASPGPGGMSSSHALAVEARAIGRERVAMKKKHGVKASILLPPTDDSAPTSPPAEAASAAVDSPSDCNPDDQHNLLEAEDREAATSSFRGDWSEHPVRRACMQVEAWVSHLPGVRTWLWTKRETFGLCAELEKAGDAALLAFVKSPAQRMASAPSRWACRLTSLREALEQVAEAAYMRDAKGLSFALSAVHPSLACLVPQERIKGRGGLSSWLVPSVGSHAQR